MDQWWKRHKIDMGGYKRSDVEDVTGRIPLLLEKCIVGGKIDLTVNGLRDIYNNAADFVQEIKDKTNGHPLKWQWYVLIYSTLRTLLTFQVREGLPLSHVCPTWKVRRPGRPPVFLSAQRAWKLYMRFSSQRCSRPAYS